MKPHQLEELLEHATPGPWEPIDGRVTAQQLGVGASPAEAEANARLIVFLRNHASELLELWEAADVWKESGATSPLWDAVLSLDEA